MNQNSEQLVRDRIDRMLLASGWVVQSKKQINLAANIGVAVREYGTAIGPADYILFVNKKPEWNSNQAIDMFRPNKKVLSKYLSYFMQNQVTINWLEGTSKATAVQWNVKVSTCREIPFPLCSLEVQKQIVQEIESCLIVCDKIEETITASLKQAEALRQSISKKAFEGALL